MSRPRHKGEIQLVYLTGRRLNVIADGNGTQPEFFEVELVAPPGVTMFKRDSPGVKEIRRRFVRDPGSLPGEVPLYLQVVET